jgi:hypothetical protein
MVDKDAKIREMKRQNILLQSKIKLLEDEMDNLHEKIDSTLKERNRLRKEIQMNLVNQLSPASDQILETSLNNLSPTHKSGTYENTNNNTTVSNFQRATSVEPLEKSFKSTSSINYWNDLNNNNNTSNTNSANWDVNYNTGYFSKYNRNSEISLKSIMSQANNKLNNKTNKNEDASFGGSMANSITSTPRTFR